MGMGTELTIMQSTGNQPTAAGISTSMINDFVAWIDRTPKTAQTYIVNLRQLLAWLRYAQVRRPERADIIRYRDWLAAPHDAIQLDSSAPDGWSYRTDRSGNRLQIDCKPNTIALYLRSVRQFFGWTAAQGLYPDIAANVHPPKITHNTHRKEALAPSDVLTIEQSIQAQSIAHQAAAATAAKDTAGRIQRGQEQGLRLNAMYQLAVNAGLRTVEISRANIRDLQTRAGQSWLYIQGKGHTEADQRKPIAPEVAAAVRAYLATRTDRPSNSSPLFVATGNRSHGKRLAPETVSRMLKKAMITAGYDSDRITPHSLRHTAGTAVMQVTGNNLYTTQQYMRHSNPATTEIYLHTEQEAAECGIAQDLYDLYHGRESSSPDRDQIEQAMSGMTPDQLRQLAAIAQGLKAHGQK